jgi:hypothetical protein
MFNDFKDLLSAFHDHDVKYLIVGGYAVSMYAQPRATKDLDIFIKCDVHNARAVYAALASFGTPLTGIKIDDLCDPSKFIRFGRPPLAVDILPAIDGIVFDEVWERRVEEIVDPVTHRSAYFISKDDLIASKLASGRPRDLADVEEIREADASSTAD